MDMAEEVGMVATEVARGVAMEAWEELPLPPTVKMIIWKAHL